MKSSRTFANVASWDQRPVRYALCCLTYCSRSCFRYLFYFPSPLLLKLNGLKHFLVITMPKPATTSSETATTPPSAAASTAVSKSTLLHIVWTASKGDSLDIDVNFGIKLRQSSFFHTVYLFKSTKISFVDLSIFPLLNFLRQDFFKHGAHVCAQLPKSST